ncbi:HNH endonuclease signature motif containing protein [Saccharothrix yanglingensis]|uniref:HNH endonuclease n=1 Tax=Saccharothrix yanglingensis TaxID=659496 RepID=A0ABU0WUR1_9PSEU|nr:HNH endonuclease signature motif containing protein [Saccharothrix yanglingensis]MDQ2583142.1 HNH endonuclease [Saccharothrix yanglingensis]
MEIAPALLTDDGVFDAVVETEAALRTLHVRRLRLLAEVLRRGLDTDTYRRVVRADPREVKRWTTQATLFLPSTSPTGQPLPPLHPVTGAVVGELSDGHLTELARAISLRLPDGSEEILVEAARSVEPKAVRQLADRIRDRAEQDRVDEVDEPAAETGDVLHLRDLPGGRLEFFGELSAESGARFTAMLEPLSAPRPDGPRDAARRRGEAFADLIHLASRSTDVPSEAGERPHISVTIDHEALRRGVGHALLDGDRHLSAAQARRIACDATVLPVVLGGMSEVLDLGRAKRTVSTAQRRALHARDRGCAFPGCHRPPQWCDAHHIQHWADGGSTDLDNLVLLCRTHHSLVHHSHWRVATTGGTPVFIPPRHVDPAQRPRQNLLHRPPTPTPALAA